MRRQRVELWYLRATPAERSIGRLLESVCPTSYLASASCTRAAWRFLPALLLLATCSVGCDGSGIRQAREERAAKGG